MCVFVIFVNVKVHLKGHEPKVGRLTKKIIVNIHFLFLVVTRIVSIYTTVFIVKLVIVPMLHRLTRNCWNCMNQNDPRDCLSYLEFFGELFRAF